MNSYIFQWGLCLQHTNSSVRQRLFYLTTSYLLESLPFCFLSIQIVITSFTTKEAPLRLICMTISSSALHTLTLRVILIVMIGSVWCSLKDISWHLLSIVSKNTRRFHTMLSCTSTGLGLTMRESILSYTIVIQYSQSLLSKLTVSFCTAVYMSNETRCNSCTYCITTKFCEWKLLRL